MRRFFIENTLNPEATAKLTGAEAHNIKTVLRMQAGDFIEIVDGSGYAYTSEIKKVADDQVQVYVHQKFHTGAESDLRLIMAVGFLKEKKMEFLIRHLTELGITRFLPMITARSIARPPEKRMAARLQRWRSIAKEAVKQSKRGRIPEIAMPVAFDEALSLSTCSNKKIIFWEKAESALTDGGDDVAAIDDAFVMIGPEGGFTEQEALNAGGQGFTPVSMGPRILKAETAAISACTLIQYLYGDIGKKSP